ncbi:MAG: GH36-type glycosyl hydrolase domain-containing protein, partial [Thermodesulfobacteriota bacterium]
NQGKTARQLSLFTYLEWCLGAGPDQHREFHKTFLETEFDPDYQVLLSKKRLWEIPSDRGHWNTRWNGIAFLGCSESIDGFEGDKSAFLGNYGSLHTPEALERGYLTNTQGKWNDSIGALHKKIRLNPGDSKSFHFFLGAEKDIKTIQGHLKKFRKTTNIESAFHRMQEKWEQLVSPTWVQTPDDAMNILTNKWLKYQTISGRLWARAAYYQQSGAFGFRDQLQDSLLLLSLKPELTRKQILYHARHQFQEGKVYHWWHTITEIGHDANASDDLLWLPFVVIHYLKETADWDILNEKIPYLHTTKSASLLDHCLKAVDCVLDRFSPRGFPLILAGDWNDGLSGAGLDGKGESVWLAQFLYFILCNIEIVLEKKQLSERVDQYRKKAETLKKLINSLGWDGHWFWRASKDNGELIGSHQNREGKIFLNPQTWAVISQSIKQERAHQVMNAMEKYLMKKAGPILLHPAYASPDENIGYLSRYAPGTRENGGVYTHAATWCIWAECMLGRGQKAYEIYKKLCPLYKGQNPDQYWAEPYVTPGNIDGPDSPHHGRGGWTWYTGSSAWLYRMTLERILGIRSDYDGLVVDPCLPEGWKKIFVRRFFRGISYELTMESDGSANAGVENILVNGEKIEGNTIPVIPNRKKVTVQISLKGKRNPPLS